MTILKMPQSEIFGQVVPSGLEPGGKPMEGKSSQIYKGIQKEYDISVRTQGSVYLASNEEEVTLLEELELINKSNDYHSQLLTRQECMRRWPDLIASYTKARTFFP